MKTFLLAALFLFICSRDVVFAQNKTLGVGITTPNPNAALHIESPTGNQGVIMPRLTTEQRSTMSSLLTAADQGLMLFDTDAKEYFVWDGTGWKSSSQFSITDPANTGDGLVVSTQGLGAAGRFTIRNSATYAHAVYGENNGDSTSAAVHGNHIGNGFGVFGKSAGTKFSSAAVYGEHVGTGDAAGAFRISNPASPYSALYGETNGSGPAVYGNQVGLGRGGQFQITNPSNTQAAIRSYTAGQGNAGFFTINNPENTNAVVLAESNGTGAAIEARNTGTGNGFAGSFHNTDSANNYPAIQASTAGAASGVRVMQTTGRGGGIDVFMQNVTSPGSGVHVDQGGQGHAGFFAVTNASSATPSVRTETNGPGSALEAVTLTGYTALHARHEGSENGNAAIFDITSATNGYPALQANTAGTGFAINAQHTGSIGDALYAERAGTGDGSAGNFRISNAGNRASAIYAATNGADGVAVGAQNDANGIAFAIWNGGLQITTSVISTGTSLQTRASAYQITSTDGTTFTVDFGPKDGEVFMVYNETINAITVGGVALASGEGKTIVVFPGGVIRGF